MRKICLYIVFILTGTLIGCTKDYVDLGGKWDVVLEENSELALEYPNSFKSHGSVHLPGSLAENGFGYRTVGSDFGILTPEYKYIGKARYTRDINIPSSWEGHEIEIFLERVLWQSRIFIDGEELSEADALGMAHVHKIKALSVGKHELSIVVDNDMIHNIGDKGHAYGAYTQGIWNGIVGRMEMRALAPTRILDIDVFSEIKNEKLNIHASILSREEGEVKVSYRVERLDSGGVLLEGGAEYLVKRGENEFQIGISTEGKLKQWSEFTPEVYLLRICVEDGACCDEFELEFGYVQYSHDGSRLLVNGKPVFLRGNLDCVHFPLTGYPSCEVDDWEEIFRKYKKYGLNHARFHSWCPPEAAFKAANRLGIYLQAEASIWIDWWMSTDMVERGRPEMDTKGHPKGLGYDAERDEFVVEEMNRMLDFYGNHPSFTMFCIGNELGNSDFDVMKQWVADLKSRDSRRLYAVSTARTITEIDDYSATHYIRNVGGTRGLRGARTDWDFEEVYSEMSIPIIAHEIGQWPVYPRWSEIGKYSGVLKARNLEGFREQAEKNGIADQDDAFAMASGALNQLMYKQECESFLRTASCAGVQLLSMQDYQGQGEALIGWLDAHWESKGIVEPEKFRQHFSATVPLLRMKKFVWTNDEVFEAEAQLSHYGENSFHGSCKWSILDEKDEIVSEGSFGVSAFDRGELGALGMIRYPLQGIKEAERLKVSIEVEGSDIRNEWNIWVFPKEKEREEEGDIFVARVFNEEVRRVLDEGGKVLLIGNELGNEEGSVGLNFYPLYWSLTFFPGQGKTNIGILINNEHPAFNYFPTDSHSDWQWETICNGAKGFILNELPADCKPLVQPIDDFHRNNKVGSVFELKVGSGSLMVCGFDLDADQVVARQLRKSIFRYMNSDTFNPQYEASYDYLAKVFEFIPGAEEAVLPDEFKNAILYVNAAGNLEKKSVNIPWLSEDDEVKIIKGVTYEFQGDGSWKDKDVSAWHGNKMELQLECPDGILGSLYVKFSDSNNKGRTGMLEFEGRKSILGYHRGDGVWLKFHVMREDSNDGRLCLKAETKTGGNLMISDVVLVVE